MIQEFQQYNALLTETGREELGKAFKAFREAYGENWLAAFKVRNPDYVLIVDLAANYNFSDAFVKFKEFITGRINGEESPLKRQALIFSANIFLDGARDDLATLHSFLKAEIDRPRF